MMYLFFCGIAVFFLLFSCFLVFCMELQWDMEEKEGSGEKIGYSVLRFLYYSNFIILCQNRNNFTMGWQGPKQQGHEIGGTKSGR